ncbi:Fc receptor-like protein 2 isoform X2 [Carcharodon carcharias]|uniref:Fc receptor-like protein 2 isoform X2 n=1 Tax=Carcharodon carcharias TaxID=13397 RepID=UPI001B7DA864|nr:Fc receptor-like protein 2 isoform X2 [Carcharodon carcharias]
MDLLQRFLLLGSITAPRLTMDPPWERFLTGDQIVLKCNAGKNLHSMKYIWNINNQGDINGDENYIIESAAVNDSGVYKCKIKSSTSMEKTTYSNTVHLNITEPDLTTIEAVPETLWVNQRLSLRCNFTYALAGEFIYTLYREGSKFTEIRSNNKSVTTQIEHVTLKDRGWYRCQAGFVEYPNAPIYSSAHKLVKIQEGPVRLSVNPEGPKEGDNVTLTCNCADPRVCRDGEYSFLRNGVIVNSDSAAPEVYRIERATVKDSGSYCCVVLSNRLKYPAQSVQITVKIPVSCPTLTSDPNSSWVALGSWVMMECWSHRGTPPIRYHLYRDQHLVNTTVTDAGPGTFSFAAQSEGDSGVYSCSASNGMTAVSNCSETLALTVAVPVSCPALTSDRGNSSVSVGDRVSLACKSHRGTPPIRYLLYRNGERLTSEKDGGSGTGAFKVNVESEGDAGLYTCGAENRVNHIAKCGEGLELTFTVLSEGPPYLLISVATTVSLFVVVLILLIVCKTQRQKKGNQDDGCQTGTGRSSPLQHSRTPAENPTSPGHEIVYAEVQMMRKTDGHGTNRARKHPGEAGYQVTYATVNHLQMERTRQHVSRREAEEPPEGDLSIYQNFRRA